MSPSQSIPVSTTVSFSTVPPSTDSNREQSANGTPQFLIVVIGAGGGVIVLFLILLIVLIVIVITRKRRKKGKKSSSCKYLLSMTIVEVMFVIELFFNFNFYVVSRFTMCADSVSAVQPTLVPSVYRLDDVAYSTVLGNRVRVMQLHSVMYHCLFSITYHYCIPVHCTMVSSMGKMIHQVTEVLT